RRDERVESGQQAVALRAAGRITQALRRKERRNCERLRIAEGEIGEGGQSRLEAVHDVEAPERERKREIRSCPDGHADSAAPGDRYGRAHDDDLGIEPVEEGAPSGSEIAGPVRGGEDGHRMPELPE